MNQYMFKIIIALREQRRCLNDMRRKIKNNNQLWIVLEDWAIGEEQQAGSHIAGVYNNEESAFEHFERLKKEFFDYGGSVGDWVEIPCGVLENSHIIKAFSVGLKGRVLTDHEIITVEIHDVEDRYVSKHTS